MLMNGQLWGKFYQTNTQIDQARPTIQQGRNLTGQTRPSKAASNGPIAGSLASQQSAKSSARLASRRSVDSARGGQHCTCAPVRVRSTRSCSQNRLGVSLTEPAGFARLLCLSFQTEKTARNRTKAYDPRQPCEYSRPPVRKLIHEGTPPLPQRAILSMQQQ